MNSVWKFLVTVWIAAASVTLVNKACAQGVVTSCYRTAADEVCISRYVPPPPLPRPLDTPGVVKYLAGRSCWTDARSNRPADSQKGKGRMTLHESPLTEIVGFTTRAVKLAAN